jgi:hypothetical protein
VSIDSSEPPVPQRRRTRCPQERGSIIQPTRFDELFTEAAQLITNGQHLRDTPPVEGGRWPVSVALRPPTDSPLSRTLDQLTTEAASLAGGHWQTGQTGSAHLTVRALEYYRPTIDADDPAVKRYRSAMDRAAGLAGPARIEVTGLTLTPGTVMASAVALDDNASLYMARLGEELGPDDWHERDYGRNLWYLNLLHFTTDIPDPEPLITWVKTHRNTSFGQVTIPTAELVRFHHTPPPSRPYMRPEVLGESALVPEPVGY